MFVIKKPYHTEKALALNNKSKYTFIVDIRATKNEVQKQVAAHYKVTVDTVNMMVYKRKKIKRYTKKRMIEGNRPKYKKAMVTLSAGDIIDVYADTV